MTDVPVRRVAGEDRAGATATLAGSEGEPDFDEPVLRFVDSKTTPLGLVVELQVLVGVVESLPKGWGLIDPC